MRIGAKEAVKMKRSEKGEKGFFRSFCAYSIAPTTLHQYIDVAPLAPVKPPGRGARRNVDVL